MYITHFSPVAHFLPSSLLFSPAPHLCRIGRLSPLVPLSPLASRLSPLPAPLANPNTDPRPRSPSLQKHPKAWQRCHCERSRPRSPQYRSADLSLPSHYHFTVISLPSHFPFTDLLLAFHCPFSLPFSLTFHCLSLNVCCPFCQRSLTFHCLSLHIERPLPDLLYSIDRVPHVLVPFIVLSLNFSLPFVDYPLPLRLPFTCFSLPFTVSSTALFTAFRWTSAAPPFRWTLPCEPRPASDPTAASLH